MLAVCTLISLSIQSTRQVQNLDCAATGGCAALEWPQVTGSSIMASLCLPALCVQRTELEIEEHPRNPWMLG